MPILFQDDDPHLLGVEGDVAIVLDPLFGLGITVQQPVHHLGIGQGLDNVLDVLGLHLKIGNALWLQRDDGALFAQTVAADALDLDGQAPAGDLGFHHRL